MSGPKIGVVGIPGKWSTEVLADALAERTGFRLVVDMATVSADLASNRVLAGRFDLGSLSGVVVKKISQEYSPNVLDRIELLRIVEQSGVRVFSSTTSMLRLIDRASCTVTLHNAGVPMPPTIITEDRAAALLAVQRFGVAVFKPLYSTKARGMRLVQADAEASQILAAIDEFRSENPMMYIQKKLQLAGRDLGMVFLGGDYLGAYARVASDDAWNTTIRSGGRYAAHEPPPETVELAARSQQLFEMDFTTVDVAETADGPVVFEVSAFGGFRGARDGIGIDAAAQYADYIVRALS